MNGKSVSCEETVDFDEIYKTLHVDIFLYAKHSMNLSEEDAKEISNEAFLELFANWRFFEPKTVRAALIWLRKTVWFLSDGLKRKNQRMPTVLLSDLEDKEVLTSVTDSAIMYEMCIEDIKKSLSSEEYRLFEKVVIESCDRKQLAEEMGITTNVLKVRWHRVRNKIKKILSGGENGNK